ncbi:MAG: zinc ribbon domain-containing protein [Candidatus Melainabacteria bacterium]|jgi:hypothetical protein|nr:zinc ribbon domain-containing protein [Candidatus Melainabacteria bacterium]
MHCQNCSYTVETGWAFCPSCGVILTPLKKFKEVEKSQSRKFTMKELTVDVIVRQALAGSDWQKVCREIMDANEITAKDVLQELHRRGYKIEDGKPVKISGKARLLSIGGQDNLVVFSRKENAEIAAEPGENKETQKEYKLKGMTLAAVKQNLLDAFEELDLGEPDKTKAVEALAAAYALLENLETT